VWLQERLPKRRVLERDWTVHGVETSNLWILVGFFVRVIASYKSSPMLLWPWIVINCIWNWFKIHEKCLFICRLLALRGRLLCESFMDIKDNLFVNLGRLSTLWNDFCNGFEATKHCMVANVQKCSPMFYSHFQHHLGNHIYPTHRTFLSTISRFYTITSKVYRPSGHLQLQKLLAIGLDLKLSHLFSNYTSQRLSFQVFKSKLRCQSYQRYI
jgi:hypothetical protein